MAAPSRLGTSRPLSVLLIFSEFCCTWLAGPLTTAQWLHLMRLSQESVVSGGQAAVRLRRSRLTALLLQLLDLDLQDQVAGLLNARSRRLGVVSTLATSVVQDFSSLDFAPVPETSVAVSPGRDLDPTGVRGRPQENASMCTTSVARELSSPVYAPVPVTSVVVFLSQVACLIAATETEL